MAPGMKPSASVAGLLSPLAFPSPHPSQLACSGGKYHHADEVQATIYCQQPGFRTGAEGKQEAEEVHALPLPSHQRVPLATAKIE